MTNFANRLTSFLCNAGNMFIVRCAHVAPGVPSKHPSNLLDQKSDKLEIGRTIRLSNYLDVY